MSGYKTMSLSEIVKEIGEDQTKKILSNFSCPLNKDIEYFLKHIALEMSKQGITRTHLVFAPYQGKYALVGYFALTMKSIMVLKSKVSGTCFKRIKKFGNVDSEHKGSTIPAPLIAQLGKNYTNGYNKLISGDELLKLALDKVSQFQYQIGGKIAYLECEDNQKLIDFYSSNGFIEFNRRIADKDELEYMNGKYYIQMLRIRKD